MPSSYFGQPLKPRPTPQTCFPPREPEPDPGLLACTGKPPTNLIITKVTTEWLPNMPRPAPYPITQGAQMANISWSYGVWTFTSFTSDRTWQNAMICLRCTRAFAGMPTWEGRITGLVIDPDNDTTRGDTGWRIGPANNNDNPRLNLNVSWILQDINLWRTRNWNINRVLITWENINDTPRSRPPNPVIPSIT